MMTWNKVKLGERAKITMGQSPPSTIVTVTAGTMPFLQGNAEFSDIHPQPKFWCDDPPRVAELDSILISVRAPVGAMNIADRRYGIGRGLAAIQITGAQRDYIWHVLNSDG